ncbi:MAG: tetratricopeptide repeat protein [Minwuia sp.]|nr:tetratricopeptide repeat protein [Minwuia sp.]
MADGTRQGWLGWLPDWLPDWAKVIVLIIVVIFIVLLFSESLRKKLADAGSGFRWLKALRSDPKQALVETVNPPVRPGLSPEEQAQLDRIEEKLDRRESGPSSDPEQRERRDRAVRDIVTDPDPDARAAAAELASDEGDIDSAIRRLEMEARTAAAEGAAKWRRIGDLVAGFDTTRARHAYEEAFRLRPEDFSTVVLLARQRRIAGDLAGALDLIPAMRQATSDDREISVADNEAGRLQLDAGDLFAARAAYERSLEVAEQLAASHPGLAAAQRDLSISLERLGDVEVQAGDLSAARAVYERSLEVREQLAASNPGSAEAQRDLSVSLNKLGDVEVEAGDLSAARAAYERSLEVAEQLSASNSGSAEAQRDLSVSLNKLGDVEVQAGDLSAARAAYERSLEVREQLSASNPGSAEAQRDLSISLEKLGDVLERNNDVVGAIRLYERSLPIARALAESNPSHPGFQRDLEITERRLGELRAKAGAE